MTSAASPGATSPPAVLYAAKSTEDVRGSIPTQLADCEQLAEQEGLRVVGKHVDEAASAYKGNRGPNLAKATAEAERLAREHGACTLVVQHSDRLARGDGKQAKHLAHYALWALEHDVTIRSVHDAQTFSDLLYAVVTGQRNHEDSRRKGLATAAGHRRRFESGKRLGAPVRDGYRLEPVLGEDGRPLVSRDGRAVRAPGLDPTRAPLWVRIFDLVEAGHTCGDVQRILNAEGSRTQRGRPWTTRTVRRGVLDDWYCGRARAYGQTIEQEHVELIDPDRWERIAALVRSDDPVGSRARAGGRPTSDNTDEYLLRGIATCGQCGSSLYTRKLAAGRMYRCRAAREGHGTCHAPYIPADKVELAITHHLDDFLGDVRGWLEERSAQNATERDQFAAALDGQRGELRKLDVRTQRARAQYERLLDAGNEQLADAALAQAQRLQAEHDHLAAALGAGEERLADWPTPTDVDVLLDFYTQLRETIQGRLTGAKGVKELNAALRTILADARLTYEGGRLSAQFRLRSSDAVIAGRVPSELELVGRPDYFAYHKWFAGEALREELNTTS